MRRAQGVEPSEAPCCVLVDTQRHSAVCLIGFGGLRRPYLDGLIILHIPVIHHVFTQHGQRKNEKIELLHSVMPRSCACISPDSYAYGTQLHCIARTPAPRVCQARNRHIPRNGVSTPFPIYEVHDTDTEGPKDQYGTEDPGKVSAAAVCLQEL